MFIPNFPLKHVITSTNKPLEQYSTLVSLTKLEASQHDEAKTSFVSV